MYSLHFQYLCVVLLGIAVSFVTGYPYFRDSLPNGKNVPHPCRPNYIWKGVGHKNILGGGVRNSFGKDFDANGRVRLLKSQTFRSVRQLFHYGDPENLPFENIKGEDFSFRMFENCSLVIGEEL